MAKEQTKLPVKKLQSNTGQIEGVPANPRFITSDKFELLKKSLTDDPEFIEYNNLLVYDNHGEYVVVGGNMRLKAIKDLGWKEVDVSIMPADTPAETIKARIIKHNADFGRDDWDMLSNEWDDKQLAEWGADIPAFVEADYTNLGYGAEIEERLNEMERSAVRSIAIEFTPEDYENAYELIKQCRIDGMYMGGILLEKIHEIRGE